MKAPVLVTCCLLLIMCAAASNAVMDTLSFQYGRSVFSQNVKAEGWWNPNVSWRNKWKNHDSEQGAAFPLSSTALVSLTDAWHFYKAITIFCILTAIALPFTKVFPSVHWSLWILVMFGLKLLYGLVFEGLFSHLLLLR